MRIAIIGKGHAGTALQRGLQRGGHDAQAVGRDAEQIRSAAVRADVIVLAVPFGAISDVVRIVGDLAGGKVLVDATNPLTDDFQLAVGFTTSGAEELQKQVPSARVVKAFNAVFFSHLDNGRAKDEHLSALIAADATEAKQTVMALARSLGFDPIDAGPLRNARLIEPMAYLNMQLAFVLRIIGSRLVH